MTLELCKTIAKEVSFDDHTIGLCPQTQVRAFQLELAQKLELESYNVRVWNIFTFIEMIYPQIWKKNIAERLANRWPGMRSWKQWILFHEILNGKH